MYIEVQPYKISESRPVRALWIEMSSSCVRAYAVLVEARKGLVECMYQYQLMACNLPSRLNQDDNSFEYWLEWFLRHFSALLGC